MSRMAITGLVLLTAAVPLRAAEPDPIGAYVERTSVEPHCRSNPEGAEIVVCARRGADRYRLPLVIPTPGDPRHEGVHQERARWTAEENPCQKRGPYLVGCGMVGVTAKMGFGAGQGPELRPLAP